MSDLDSNEWYETLKRQRAEALPITVSVVKSEIPVTFRLAKKPDGEIILQGGYRCQRGRWGESWIEWEDLETVDLPA